MYINKSKIKDAAKNMNVGNDFYEGLNNAVEKLIETASRRAKENGRSTIKARDL